MKKLGYIGAAFALPLLAFAQVSSIYDLGTLIINIINTVLVPVLFAIAFIIFLWGVFQYFILGGADEEKRATGQALMLWGIIGFFIMVSIWGLVHILTGTVSLNNNVPDYPSAPTQ